LLELFLIYDIERISSWRSIRIWFRY